MKVHFTRVLPSRWVPPSGFDYPLDGLLPSNPCRFCFTPAALMGLPLRSFPRSQGIQGVAAPNEPTCRFSRHCSRRTRRRAGLTSRGFWALTLTSVPSLSQRVSAAPGWLLPWVLSPSSYRRRALSGLLNRGSQPRPRSPFRPLGGSNLPSTEARGPLKQSRPAFAPCSFPSVRTRCASGL
jgi:hypothetical protein